MKGGCFSSDFMFRTRHVYEALSVIAGVNIMKHRASLETSRVVLAPVMPQQVSRIHCHVKSDPGIWELDACRRNVSL